MKTTFFAVVIVMTSFVFPGFAQDEVSDVERNPAQLIQNRELIERAKSRLYKGGSEEGELRVQAVLPKPQRKIAPVVDKKEMEKESQDHD